MKTHVLYLSVSLLIIDTAFGRIINAYEKDIQLAKISLTHLQGMPMEKKIRKQIMVLEQMISNYEITATMLSQFRIIAPDLYNQIETIRDFKDRPVDVYLKFVPQCDLPRGLLAITGIRQLPGDPHAYNSDYGPYSVSVKIASAKNSLLILAHEFGHIAYQVPNLASYARYFALNYANANSGFGHKNNDPSGHKAAHFEKSFLSDLIKLKKRRKVLDSSK